jgi:hypothetical protein
VEEYDSTDWSQPEQCNEASGSSEKWKILGPAERLSAYQEGFVWAEETACLSAPSISPKLNFLKKIFKKILLKLVYDICNSRALSLSAKNILKRLTCFRIFIANHLLSIFIN